MRLIGMIAALLLAFVPAVRGAVAAPVVVSTLVSWDGSNNIGDFGSAGFSAWGQFLRAPVGTNRLLDFTFVLSDGIQGGSGFTAVPVEFQAHLVRYDPVTRRTVGPLIYSSAAVTVPLTDGFAFANYTFTPDAAVTADDWYLMFLFANNYTLTVPNDSRLRVATTGSDLLPGGMNFPVPADGSLAGVLADQWRFSAGEDLAFSATFDFRPPTTVPEPASLLLMVAAGWAATGVARRRKSIGAEPLM